MAGLGKYIVLVLASWYMPAYGAGKSSPKQAGITSETPAGSSGEVKNEAKTKSSTNQGQHPPSPGPEPLHSLVKWDGIQKLTVRVGSGLTQKQLSTLNSGFSTFSRLSVGMKEASREDREKWTLASTACTVKLDMWEERYEITLLSGKPAQQVSKSLETYLEMCLKVEMEDGDFLRLLRQKGGQLVAILEVEQISSSQAHKIKEWLVRQQSAVMRGLFTHMLGEMTLSARSEVTIKVSPDR